MAPAAQRFLQPALLGSLAGMELRVRTVVEGILSGLHRSPFRGLSSEFSEYRQYQLGDELSRLDWKVYARSDRYYIKEFEDETNLNAHIILDASASMNFGTGPMTKWQYGATVAASLAYLLQGQNDGLSLVVLDEAIRVETQTRATRGHLIHIIGEMEKTTPSRGTRLADVLHQVASKITRKSLILLVSDLLDDPPAVIHALRHLQFGGNEVAVFHVADPAELRFEFQGPMLFVDPETRMETLAFAEQTKSRYLQSMNAFLDNYREEMGKTNIQYALTDTSVPLDRPLYAFLTRGN